MTLTATREKCNSITDDAPLRAGIKPTVTASRGTEDRTGPDGSKPSPCPDGGIMPSSDTPQTEPLVLNSRADLRDLLIRSGLARAAAEKVARGGWPALAGELTETDMAEECAELARALAATLNGELK